MPFCLIVSCDGCDNVDPACCMIGFNCQLFTFDVFTFPLMTTPKFCPFSNIFYGLTSLNMCGKSWTASRDKQRQKYFRLWRDCHSQQQGFSLVLSQTVQISGFRITPNKNLEIFWPMQMLWAVFNVCQYLRNISWCKTFCVFSQIFGFSALVNLNRNVSIF